MTREEASFYLANMDRKYMEEGMSEALDMAIKALGQEPETVTEFADRCRECGAKYGKLLKQEPCYDCISRQAAIEIARSNIPYRLNKESEYARELLQKTMAEINSLPSVTPQQRSGRWKFIVYDANRIGHYECSECHWNVLMNVSAYCPHCGAKMEVE